MTQSRSRSRSASPARRGKPGGSRAASRKEKRKKKTRPPARTAGGRVAEELTRAKRSSHASDDDRKKKRAQAKPESKPKAKAKSRAKVKLKAKPEPKDRLKAKVKPKARAKAKPERKERAKPWVRVRTEAAAERARHRRSEERGIADQLQYEREERARLRAAQRRERAQGLPPDLTRLAISWLEQIRNVIAGVAFCSLDLTSPEPGARTPWLIVGRYTFAQPVDYRTLADAVRQLRNDVALEVTIGPQRLSQIRIVYRDPRGRRGEGDSIVSKTGAWEFVISDLLGELVGAGPEDEDSLAVRYAETMVPILYVYFAADLVPYTVRVFRKTL
jgi:hypothetical protein